MVATMRKMVYFSIDCEASGPVPVLYNLLSIGVTSVDIDWESLDEQPVRLIFAIAGSAKSPAEVVNLLGEISRLLHSPALREWLKGAESAQEVHDLLRARV